MIKHFCDWCGSEVYGDDYRLIKMMLPDGTPFLKTAKTGKPWRDETCFNTREICLDCAMSIINTIKGIESGGAEIPLTRGDEYA